MIKHFTLFIGLLITMAFSAQNRSKQEVAELMADDTCKCISKKKFKKSDPADEKEMALGLCLITSFNEHKSKSKYYSNKTLADIESIGEDVGFIMASKCANDFLSIFSSEELVNIIDDSDNDISINSTLDEALTIEVDLLSMSNDAISYITTKDDFDKTHTFLILDTFEGYELLKKSNFNKAFKITFKEIEVFDLSEKQYIIKKVLTGLEMI
ncbi:hypothetical protein [uncultured Winogradskyella sp.]|uniref:hypothetical protein n=1 Tax=uncultured Winogradskyella sp. TaxID=395353 RepID=UPI0026071547|nr:hypothetical protein [uncultured Winogradskyella sp.]